MSNYDGRVTVAELLRREGMTQEVPVAGTGPATGWTGYDDYADEAPTDLIPVAEILRRENVSGQATQFSPRNGGFQLPATDPYPREDERESITELYGREDGLENVVGLYDPQEAGQVFAREEPAQYADQHADCYEDEHDNVDWFQRDQEAEPEENAAEYPASSGEDEESTRLYADDDRDDEVAELLPRLGKGDRRRAGKIGAVAAGVVALAGLAVAAFGAGHSSGDSMPPLAGGLGGGPVDPPTSSIDSGLLPNGPLSPNAAVPGVPEGSSSTSGAAQPGVPGSTGGKTSSRSIGGLPPTTTDRPAPTSSSPSPSSSSNAGLAPSSSTTSSSSSASTTTTRTSPSQHKSSSPSSGGSGQSGSNGGVLGSVTTVISGTLDLDGLLGG